MNAPEFEQMEMALQKSSDDNIKQLRAEMAEINSDILNENSVKSYVLDIKQSLKKNRFSHLKSQFKEINGLFESRYGTKALSQFNKLVLVLLIKDSLIEIKNQTIPSSVYILFLQWFERVLRDLIQQPDSYYHHDNIIFIKDIAVCSLKAIPIGGAWFIEEDRIGIRILIFGEGVRQVFKYIKTVLFNTYGLKPFYSVHVYERYMPRFSAEELRKAYFRLHELLILNPRIKGIYRASWLLDPKLKEICPHLEFNRKIPEENGAVMFRIGTTMDAEKNATSVSPRRQELFLSGKYIPAVHAFIWTRQRFFYWVEKQNIR